MASDARWGLWIGTMLLTLGVTTPVWAEGSYIDGASRKLGRGIANVATCPLELIRTSELVGRQDGYVAALSIGLIQGAWRTLLRGVVGIVEIATFYIEIPNDFQPLVHPEFVWAHGDWSKREPSAP